MEPNREKIRAAEDSRQRAASVEVEPLTRPKRGHGDASPLVTRSAGTRLTLFSDHKPDSFFAVIKFWLDEISDVALALKTGMDRHQPFDTQRTRIFSLSEGFVRALSSRSFKPS